MSKEASRRANHTQEGVRNGLFTEAARDGVTYRDEKRFANKKESSIAEGTPKRRAQKDPR